MLDLRMNPKVGVAPGTITMRLGGFGDLPMPVMNKEFVPLTPPDTWTYSKMWLMTHGLMGADVGELVPGVPGLGQYGSGSGLSLVLQFITAASIVTIATLAVLNYNKGCR